MKPKDSPYNTSDEEDDEEEEEEEELLPKTLPERANRGRRLGSLVGEAAEKDKEFWEGDQWREDADDEEWSTEDEKHYRDEFDSDFDRGSTDEDEAEQAKADEAEQRRLDREEAQRKKKKNVYQDPRALAALKKGKGKAVADMIKKARAAQARRGKPPPAAIGRSQLSRGGRVDKRVPIQEDLLAAAAKIENQNTASLQSQLEAESWKLAAKEQKQQAASLNFKGLTEVWVSWIPANSDDTPRYAVDTYFFMNIDRPDESKIPSNYARRTDVPSSKPLVYCSVYPNVFAKYRDPATGLPYSNLRAFLRLRRRTVIENVSKLSDKLLSLDTLLNKSFTLLNSHYKHDEAVAAAVSNATKSRDSLLDERKRRKLIRAIVADPSDGGGDNNSSTPSRPSSPGDIVTTLPTLSNVRPGTVTDILTTGTITPIDDEGTINRPQQQTVTQSSIDDQVTPGPKRRGRPPKPRPPEDASRKQSGRRRKTSPSGFPAVVDASKTDWESLTAAFAMAIRNQPGTNPNNRVSASAPNLMSDADAAAAAYWRGMAYAQWYQQSRPTAPPSYHPMYGWQQQQPPQAATPYPAQQSQLHAQYSHSRSASYMTPEQGLYYQTMGMAGYHGSGCYPPPPPPAGAARDSSSSSVTSPYVQYSHQQQQQPYQPYTTMQQPFCQQPYIPQPMIDQYNTAQHYQLQLQQQLQQQQQQQQQPPS